MARLQFSLLFLVLCLTIVYTQASDSESDKTPGHPDLKHDGDDDKKDYYDCDDDDDDDDDDSKEKHGKDEKDKDHHERRKRCGHKTIVKVLVTLAIGVVVLAVFVGTFICFIRYRKRNRQLTESTTNLQPGRSQAYIITESQYPKKEPLPAQGWPVVSTEPLPGKM